MKKLRLYSYARYETREKIEYVMDGQNVLVDTRGII